MNKTTKSLWIYAAALFIIAIALIITATLLQVKIVSPDDGNVEVLGTFTKDLKQSITALTEENLNLTTKINELTDKTTQLQAELDSTKALYEKEMQNKKIINQLYDAYKTDDYDTIEALLPQITKEEADAFVNGVYNNAKKNLTEYRE